MKKKVIIHLLVLFASVLLTFGWVSTPVLAKYSLQLTAFLVITLIITRHLLKLPSFRLAESTISTISVLLLVNATDGLSSPLFFLNYFLLFELSLLLEPLIPLVLSLLLVLFYFFSFEDKPLYFLMELIAFPFMTPLAFLFGKIYRKEENQKKEIKNLTHKIEELKEELTTEEIDQQLKMK